MTLTHFPNPHMHMATWGVGKNLQRDFSAPQSTGSRARPPRSGPLPPVPAPPRRGLRLLHAWRGAACSWAANPGGGDAFCEKAQVLLPGVVFHKSCRVPGAQVAELPPRSGGCLSVWEQGLAPCVIRLTVGRGSNQDLNGFQKHPKCLYLQQNTSGIVVIDDNTEK